MRYDPESFVIRFPVPEAIDKGLLPSDLNRNYSKCVFHVTNEFMLDNLAHWKSIFAVRTGPITETELAEWRQEWNRLHEEPIETKKTRLHNLGFKWGCD